MILKIIEFLFITFLFIFHFLFDDIYEFNTCKVMHTVEAKTNKYLSSGNSNLSVRIH